MFNPDRNGPERANTAQMVGLGDLAPLVETPDENVDTVLMLRAPAKTGLLKKEIGMTNFSQDPYMAFGRAPSGEAPEPVSTPDPNPEQVREVDPDAKAPEVQLPGQEPNTLTPEERAELETALDGSASDVLDYVGDDKERAKLAYDAEQAREKPRKGLSNQLREMVENESE